MYTKFIRKYFNCTKGALERKYNLRLSIAINFHVSLQHSTMQKLFQQLAV